MRLGFFLLGPLQAASVPSFPQVTDVFAFSVIQSFGVTTISVSALFFRIQCPRCTMVLSAGVYIAVLFACGDNGIRFAFRVACAVVSAYMVAKIAGRSCHGGIYERMRFRAPRQGDKVVRASSAECVIARGDSN